MECTVRLAILGDYDATRRSHTALEDALRHSMGARHRAIVWDWVRTETLAIEPVSVLSGTNAIIAATDDDCASVDGALAGIRLARQRRIPFLAIGVAFRHAVVEFARNVLGLAVPVEPGLPLQAPGKDDVGDRPRRRSGAFFLESSSRTAALYGRWRAVEETAASVVLDATLRAPMERAGLRVTGTDSNGEPTVLELHGHPFFIAAQFEPQLGSRPLTPAPLVRAVVDAGIHHRDRRGTPHGLAAVAAG